MSKRIVHVDGVKYVEEKSSPGNRAVVVVDDGWMFAGDVHQDSGRIILKRVVWVFSWNSIDFDDLLRNPGSENVSLKLMENDVDIPSISEVFRVPVNDSWGL
jgi:hypothetical protein